MDDSPLILGATKEALESAGFVVATATSIAEFEVQLAAATTDLIILDVEMPEMFGDHVATVLRHMRGMKTPIYLFSTRSEAELESRVEEAQVDGYIPKSEGVEGLVRRVRAAFGQTDAPPPLSNTGAHAKVDLSQRPPMDSKAPTTMAINPRPPVDLEALVPDEPRAPSKPPR